MTRLAILAMDVSNCGPWRGQHRFEFPPTGIAILCAPNETGKTTLLRLVTAILWDHGVPAFNWFAEDNDEYQASLEYERQPVSGEVAQNGTEAGIRFCMARDFRTRRVTLSRLEDGQWRPVQAGRHKRKGRTADNEQWFNLVQNVFASISPEAFERLAMLSPPFDPQPEGQLVQSLISGAGENTRDEALQALLERHRELTRFSRTAGISSSDARKPGRLEELRERRERVQADLALAKQTLERGLQIREEIQRLDERIASLEAKQQELAQSKQVLDTVRRLVRERRVKGELERSLKRTLDQWHKLADKREELIKQQEKFPSFLREGDSEHRKQWRKTLEDFKERTRRLVEKSAKLSDDSLRQSFSDVWNWPDDAALRVEQVQKAVDCHRQAEQRLHEAESRLAGMRPVLDRRRQMPVVLGVAVVAMLIVFLISALLHYSFVGIFLGIITGILGGLITSQVHRPQCWPEDYFKLRSVVEQTQTECQQSLQELEKAWEDVVAWAQTRDLGLLLQSLGRFRTLRDARVQLNQEKAEFERDAAQLTVGALPEELQELCGLTGDLPRESPLHAEVFERGLNVLGQFEELIAQDSSYRQQQETLLRGAGVNTIEALEERYRQAELDLQGNLLESRQLAENSPLADEALSWEGQKLENEFRQIEMQTVRLHTDLEEVRRQRNDRERELARWEGQNVVNVAQAQEELATIDREIEALTARARSIERAYHLIDEAYTSYSQQHRVAIESNINHLMRGWTGRNDREFVIDGDFSVTFRIPELVSELQATRDCKELSQGTRDQLALAIRWAILDRLAGDVVLPLLLDDCFHMWDAERRANLLRFLQSHSDRQIILVTHDESFLNWGQPVKHLT